MPTQKTTRVHLICLKDENEHVADAIKALWPHEAHFQINETQFLIDQPINGGKSLYDRIQEKVESSAGKDEKWFGAMIVRFHERYHGVHRADLWEWLQSRMCSGE